MIHHIRPNQEQAVFHWPAATQSHVAVNESVQRARLARFSVQGQHAAVVAVQEVQQPVGDGAQS